MPNTTIANIFRPENAASPSDLIGGDSYGLGVGESGEDMANAAAYPTLLLTDVQRRDAERQRMKRHLVQASGSHAIG